MPAAAYHAGLIRTTINALDAQSGYTLGYVALTQKISNLRATLSKAVAPTTPAFPTGTFGDDVPLTPGTNMVSLAGGASVTATTIVDADLTNLVDNHPEPVIGLLFQDVIQQGRFACTEKPGEDADRDHFSWRHKKERKRAI